MFRDDNKGQYSFSDIYRSYVELFLYVSFTGTYNALDRHSLVGAVGSGRICSPKFVDSQHFRAASQAHIKQANKPLFKSGFRAAACDPQLQFTFNMNTVLLMLKEQYQCRFQRETLNFDPSYSRN